MAKAKGDVALGKDRLERQKASPGKSWFFGVGINQYREFSDLNNAVKDVEDVRDLLTDKYDAEPVHTIILTNEKATKDDIIDQVQNITHPVPPFQRSDP